jgi:hypothetical protein
LILNLFFYFNVHKTDGKFVPAESEQSNMAPLSRYAEQQPDKRQWRHEERQWRQELELLTGGARDLRDRLKEMQKEETMRGKIA